MLQNIVSIFPISIPRQKVFLDENKIIFTHSNIQNEIHFKDVAKITIQPMGWIFFLHQTNDLFLVTHSGKNFKLYNLSVPGVHKLIEKVKSANSILVVHTLNLEADFFTNSFIRMPGIMNSSKVSSRISFFVLTVAILVLIVLLVWSRSQ